MSNEKRFVVKHGLQSQNIEFISPDKSKNISVSMLDSGSISSSGNMLLGTTTDFTSTTVPGAIVATGFGIYPNILTTGTTNTTQQTSILANPTMTSDGTSGTQVFNAIISSPTVSNSGVGTANVQLLGGRFTPVITSTGVSGRISSTGVFGAAYRDSSTDLSTFASSIYGGNFAGIHGFTVPNTATTSLLYGLISTAQNHSGIVSTAQSGVVSSILVGTFSSSQTTTSTAVNAFRNNQFIVGTSTSLGPATVTNGYGLSLAGPTVGATGTMTNYYAIYAGAATVTGTLTNRYGIWLEDTVATSYIGGSLGVGNTTPTQKLDIAGNATLRNSTTATNLTIHNTYTDASNYERAKIGWNTNVLEIGTENAGTGTLRNINLIGGNVGIGTSTPSAKLDVVGDIEVNSNVNLNSEATTLATVTKTQIASFPVASFRSGKLIVQAYDSVTGEVQISELLVAHNGTTASGTEYGVVFTGTTSIVIYDVDISAGNVRLMATRTTANSTQYKISETLMVA